MGKYLNKNDKPTTTELRRIVVYLRDKIPGARLKDIKGDLDITEGQCRDALSFLISCGVVRKFSNTIRIGEYNNFKYGTLYKLKTKSDVLMEIAGDISLRYRNRITEGDE